MPSNDLAPQKAELLIRILIQNLTLLLAVAAFAGLSVATLGWPASAWVVACVHALVSGALLLQWCHNGVRTMQLKSFLLEQEGREPANWEVWLPAHRPDGLLGTRWFVSTKGVFLGTQVAMAGAGRRHGRSASPVGISGLRHGIHCFGDLLLTNPKE